MSLITGTYNMAKIFADHLEDKAADQILDLCNQSFVQDSTIRIMPDVHAGAGCTVGTTMTITNKVVPNLVGVDIGCGMETVQISNKHLDLEKLDQVIYDKIPAGFQIRKRRHPYSTRLDLDQLRCLKKINYHRATHSIGTLGGGNHFIELNQDSSGNLYLVIHSGSRHLGTNVARHYQEAAYAQLNQNDEQSLQSLIDQYKATNREKELEQALRERKKQISNTIPPALAYATGDLFLDYIHDMKIVQAFAALNRQAMMHEIIQAMSLDVVDQFTTIHNYIDTQEMILRKGAVSAKAGEKLLIPINMRDGSLLCRGLGNPDWNYSAPHGAGRLMSRTQAKATFSLEHFQAEVKDIYTTSATSATLDECPMAYKDIDQIIQQIQPTVTILEIIKPLYNFKAGN